SEQITHLEKGDRFMFKRTNLMAVAMLGLGTLLGYGAAWGKLPSFGRVNAAAQDASASSQDPCCVAPQRPAIVSQPGSYIQPVSLAQAGGGQKGQKEQYQTPKPGNPRGATTGPTDAPGYDHPNQYAFTKPTQIAPNMEPVIVHPSQVKEAMDKLTKAQAKFG